MNDRTSKTKTIIAVFSPILIGAVGYYICTVALLSTIRWGQEGAISWAFYMMAYYFMFMPCVFFIGVFSLLYLFPLVYRLRYIMGIVLLFLFYLALLVVMPPLTYKWMYGYEEAKIQTRFTHQQEIQKRVDMGIQKGTNIDEVKMWLQDENIRFVHLEETHEIIARIPKKRLLDSGTTLIEFPMFIQFSFDSNSNLKTSLVVTKHWEETYKTMKSRFKERSTSHEKKQRQPN